jgi:3-dehydroquinate synthase
MKFKIDNSETEVIFSTDIIDQLENRRTVYIVDSRVNELFPHLFRAVKDQSKILVFEASEQSKNLESLQQIYHFLKEKEVTRNDLIVGIGGGITTDIVSFAASTYKRGCRLILIPTTLLGMIDAAIGGKTGINFGSVKNGIGSFFPAEKVFIDTDFLHSQAEEDFKTGFVEIIKMSFLPHSKLSEMLISKMDIREIIEEAIRTKFAFCENDLHDRNSRRLLNLGHTFGHVLEAVSNYEIPHGKAVAIGIRAAAKFSRKYDFISEHVFKQIIERLDMHELPENFDNRYMTRLQQEGEAILKQDKKADENINLVLFNNRQELFIHRTDKSRHVIKILEEFADV